MNLEELKDPDNRIPRLLEFMRLNASLGREYTIKPDDLRALLNYYNCLLGNIGRLQEQLEDAECERNQRDSKLARA